MRRDTILRLIYDTAIGYDHFDQPDYGGLAKEVTKVLSPAFIKGVQGFWDVRETLNRKAWCKATLERIIELGDKASLYTNVTIPKPKTPTSLIHCTIDTCGRVHLNPDKCPTCGNDDSQRPLKYVGAPIFITKT